MHITLKLCDGIPGLREPKILAAWIRGVSRAQKKGLRIQHFSIQKNHIHVIAECDDNDCLRKGMISLSGSLVWALRRIFSFYGRVFVSRYHVNTIKVPRIMRHTLKYVLFNHDHHGSRAPGGDEYSSVFALRERRALIGDTPLGDCPRWQRWINACLSPAGSWMQNVGWLRST